MAETYNRLELDVNIKPHNIITAVQKDSDSRYLDVFLFNNGVPIDLTGHEVRIYMRKPEKGGEIFNDGKITEPENGRCQFLLTTAALEKTGHLQTQISIWKDNREILSTQIFEIFVTKSLRTTGSIEGSNEYGALVVLFQNLYQSIDLMTDMVQNFGKAGEVAAGIPAGTFWQMLEAVYAVNKDALENASVSEVLNRIGLTGDTGGSQTEGTVFGKENAILETLKEQNAKIFTSMVWKQTAKKAVTTATSGVKILSFSFESPVKFRAINIEGTIALGQFASAYFINGESSFTALASIASSTARYMIAVDGGSRNRFLLKTSFGERENILQDIWITQIDIHFPAVAADKVSTYKGYVEYQEGQAG